MDVGRQVEKRPGEEVKNAAVNLASSGNNAVVSSDRPPLLPLNNDASSEERRNRDGEDKERRTREAEERERQSKEQRAGFHPLQHRFVFWYTRRTPGVRSQTSYEDSMKRIAEFSTDAANRSGGKWIIRFKKLVSGRFWEDLVLAIIGDQLEYGDSVCGAVLSIRYGEDILSVWNKNAGNNQAVMALRDSIKRHLHLPVSYLMEYKPHDASLRDNSSFRNTWLRG
ncbi:hypothetical protein AXG93_4620s1740 [Marchantia polymorpha subsp. ruderalis]|uniref:mRNA cap-binding protein n=1 Tax=Marchantia polymorpha subsp. ruderalis TaxID=1480154 RepID=A0A176VX15_MARPO|nr:hypothetical protein AXG93_4620s1740 [Marchantia polymorpha subsp. ruderalis]